MNKNPIKQCVTAILATLVLVLGAGVTQAAWTPPAQLPPDGNVDAPINVGYSGQIKDGWLLIKGMLSVGVPNTYGLIVENGNVGIGTLTPTSPLTVKKSVGSYGTPLLVEQSGSADASYKNVAIFAGNRGSVNASDNTNIGLWQKNSTVGNYANINFYNSQGQNAAYLGAKFVNHGAGGAQSGAFVMGTYNSGIGTDRLYISETGNVGIGTVTPTAKLEVAGQVKITGGSPGAGKVLTSDASGLATWATPSGGSVSRVLLDTPTNLYVLQMGFNLSGSGSETSGTIQAGTTAGIPAGAKSVLLYGKIDDNSSGAVHFMQFKHPGQTNWKYLLHSLSPYYGVDNSAWIPLDSSGRLDWKVSQAYVSEGHLLQVQGYEVY